MSAKKYYWLKLKEDFFEEDTIAWLEEQQNGKEYALFYLKLCLKSLKTNGTLIRNVGQMLVPYDTKKLAEITNTDFDTAMVAMELLKRIGLVEVLENGEIYLTQLNSMVGSETSKAALMRKTRAKKALESDSGNIVTQALPEPSNNVDTEIENRDRDKEIEKEIENRDKENKKSIDYLAIVNAYKETCVSLPTIRSLSENRKKAIRARLNSGYTQDDFITLFKKAQESDFLKGKNDRNWNADFDWLIKDANMAKVLEGKYDNKRPAVNQVQQGNEKDAEVMDWLHQFDL